jgi:uncharacterized protein (TIGR03067 family)
LVGVWEAKAFTNDGIKGLAIATHWTFREDGTFEFSTGGDAGPVKGTYKFDSTAKPMTLDLTYNERRQDLLLIEIDGENMRVCKGSEPAKRPAEIKGTGGFVIWELKRQPPG